MIALVRDGSTLQPLSSARDTARRPQFAPENATSTARDRQRAASRVVQYDATSSLRLGLFKSRRALLRLRLQPVGPGLFINVHTLIIGL